VTTIDNDQAPHQGQDRLRWTVLVVRGQGEVVLVDAAGRVYQAVHRP
jgi:hypothetical protein